MPVQVALPGFASYISYGNIVPLDATAPVVRWFPHLQADGGLVERFAQGAQTAFAVTGAQRWLDGEGWSLPVLMPAVESEADAASIAGRLIEAHGEDAAQQLLREAVEGIDDRLESERFGNILPPPGPRSGLHSLPHKAVRSTVQYRAGWFAVRLALVAVLAAVESAAAAGAVVDLRAEAPVARGCGGGAPACGPPGPSKLDTYRVSAASDGDDKGIRQSSASGSGFRISPELLFGRSEVAPGVPGVVPPVRYWTDRRGIRHRVKTYITKDGLPYVHRWSDAYRGRWLNDRLTELDRWFARRDDLPARATAKGVQRKVRKRLRMGWSCGQRIRVPRCRVCGKHDHEHRTLNGDVRHGGSAFCGCRTCEVCQRRHAVQRLLAVQAYVDHLRESRPPGYRLRHVVLSPQYDPADPAEFTPARLRERVLQLGEAWSLVYRKVLRGPNRQSDRGLLRHVEITEAGFVHGHGLYWGPFAPWQAIQGVLDAAYGKGRVSVQIRDSYCYDLEGNKVLSSTVADDDPALAVIERSAVREAVKYVTKSQSETSAAPDERRKRVDPTLAAAWEIALDGVREWQGYGVLRSLKLSCDDLKGSSLDATDAAQVDSEDVADVPTVNDSRLCPHCGAKGTLDLVTYDAGEYLRIMRAEGASWPRVRAKPPPPS
ncbi:MAG: hypothetical protein PHC68_17470 [Syntrophorhabdaceae bacterium]|nr:hypothetical protein [Syntrophorhabdaceae bacterium]